MQLLWANKIFLTNDKAAEAMVENPASATGDIKEGLNKPSRFAFTAPSDSPLTQLSGDVSFFARKSRFIRRFRRFRAVLPPFGCASGATSLQFQ
jgi:hypothetical protein